LTLIVVFQIIMMMGTAYFIIHFQNSKTPLCHCVFSNIEFTWCTHEWYL